MSSTWAQPRVSRATLTGVLIGAALAAWIVTVGRMRGMDAGPGTSLGGLGWYLGVWVTMMAAMMLPSTAPMVVVFDRVSAERARRGQAHVPTSIFILAYLLVWAAYGLVAYGLYRLVVHAVGGPLAWNRAGPYVVGAAVAAAGLYELTPLKSACLRHCRSPLAFVVRGWREGSLGALRMGAVHGSYCVGCCWGLMLVLFALGVMSLTWMAVVAGLVFVQKVLPGGEAATRVFAVGFVAAGIWIVASPGSVPGLVQPDSDGARRARDRMMHMEPEPMPAMPTAPADLQMGGGDGMGP